MDNSEIFYCIFSFFIKVLAAPKERDCFMVINPAQIEPINGENYTHFLLDQPQQYAKGIKKTF
jgi:hypothetical protein